MVDCNLPILITFSGLHGKDVTIPIEFAKVVCGILDYGFQDQPNIVSLIKKIKQSFSVDQFWTELLTPLLKE